MDNIFSRLELLVGAEGIKKLNESRVIVFGIGGVGGHVAESLVRSGIGSITLVDNDTVSITNLNRQIIATQNSVGKSKVTVMEERLLSINPNCHIETKEMFYLPETADEIDLTQYDYVIDAIDTITSKIELAVRSQNQGFKLISSMGTGNKFAPEMLEVADIYKTSICPLAKVMRRELKKRRIKSLKVVYSKELPKTPEVSTEKTSKRTVPGSTAFTPGCAGLIISSVVIRELLGM